jgi:hypothetical protein
VSTTELVKSFSKPELNISWDVGRAIAYALQIIGDTRFGFWSLMVSDAGKRVFSWRFRKPGIDVVSKYLEKYRSMFREDADLRKKEALRELISSIQPVGDSILRYLLWKTNKAHGLVTEDEPPTYMKVEKIEEEPEDEDIDSTPAST